jgi:predicted metal-dependent HD superfamily phosphohydrolase
MNYFIVHNMHRLVALYSAPGRHYHNLNHINFCLARMEEAKKQDEFKHFKEEQWTALEIAIWFHDAIYNAEAQMVTPGYSEFESIEFMRYCAVDYPLAINNPEWYSIQRDAEDLILATAKHGKYIPETELEALMLDIDLASLALPWRQFKDNTDDVVMEYALFRPYDMIAVGNAKFLKGLIETNDRIYHTGWGYDAFEKMARWNIAHRVLEALPVEEQR